MEIVNVLDPKVAAAIKESADELTKNKMFVNAKMIVKNADDLNIAVEFLTGLKAYFRAKEDKRKEIVDPIKRSVKLIDAEYKKITDKIQDAITGIEAEIFKYRQAEAVRIAKINAATAAKVATEQAKIDAAFKKDMKGTRGDERIILQAQKESAIASVAVAAPVKVQDKSIGGTSFRKIWDFEIVNEAEIPRVYLTPDSVQIRNDIVKNGVREIRGVRIFQREVSATRL